jgi:hypothetical protein
MKHTLLVSISAAVLMIACNSAGDKPADVSAIKNDSAKFTTLQWQDTAVNFGSGKMGKVVDITFIAKNTGDKPLYLYDVHPGCGCTVADYTKEPIPPGKEGKIDARFDTKKAHAGEVHKVIHVSANNSNPAAKTLTFTGTILPADSTTTVKK